jgi:hypothetical protein
MWPGASREAERKRGTNRFRQPARSASEGRNGIEFDAWNRPGWRVGLVLLNDFFLVATQARRAITLL